MSDPDPKAIEACRQFAEMGGWPAAKAFMLSATTSLTLFGAMTSITELIRTKVFPVPKPF